MRLLRFFLMFVALSAAPALAQTDAPPVAAAAALPADASNPSIDYAALREQVARQNKILTEEVATARAIVTKNRELLKEAQKLQAANVKLAAEKKKLEAQGVDLDKQREALKSAQKSDPAGSN